MPEVTDIRITDLDTRRIVERIGRKRGDKSMARTAGNLIRERAMQLGEIDGDCAAPPSASQANSSSNQVKTAPAA